MDLTSILVHVHVNVHVHVHVEGVLVEKNRACTLMGHVEPINKNVMIDILRCFMLRDEVPPACDLLLKSVFLSTSRSWIPVADAETLLHMRTFRHVFCRSGMPEKMYRVAILKPRENLQRLFEHPPCVVLR